MSSRALTSPLIRDSLAGGGAAVDARGMTTSELYDPARHPDNVTHHLLPRAAGPTCRYCKRTRSQLVELHGDEDVTLYVCDVALGEARAGRLP